MGLSAITLGSGPSAAAGRACPRPQRKMGFARWKRSLVESSTDLLQTLFEARPVGGIEFRGASHCRDLRGIERADNTRRRADDQRVLGKLLAYGNHRTGADDATAADPGAVHDDRAHADQRAALDGASMQNDVVPDGAPLPAPHG